MSLLILCIGFPWSSFSSNNEKESATSPDSFEGQLIEANQSVSESLVGIAETIDLFLVGEKHTQEEKNKTRAIISGQGLWSEGGKIDTSTNFSLQLQLPHLARHWKLRFSNFDAEEEFRSTYARSLSEDPVKESFGTAIEFFQYFKGFRTSFRPRIKFKDPLQTSYLLRFEKGVKLPLSHLGIKADFFADSEEGTGQFSSYLLRVPLTTNWSMYLINEEEYTDAKNLFQVTNGISFGRPLKENMSLSHSLVFESNNQPNYHLDTISLFPTFSHQLYKNILHYQLSPRLSFKKTRRFKGQAGFAVYTQLIF